MAFRLGVPGSLPNGPHQSGRMAPVLLLVLDGPRINLDWVFGTASASVVAVPRRCQAAEMCGQYSPLYHVTLSSIHSLSRFLNHVCFDYMVSINNTSITWC